MTTSVSQFVFSPWLTPARVVATSNVVGTYYNGPNNNGVGATLTIAASSLTIDSVVLNVGNRVLLSAQSSSFQNGVYVVESISSTVVLQRSFDQQNIEQLHGGENIAIAAGSVNAGDFYTLVEPLPQNIGVDAFVYNGQAAVGAVSFSGGPSVANAIPVFSDTSGDIKPQTTTATLAFGLTAATGNIAASTGNIQAGSSGNAGDLIAFPSSAANGTMIIAAGNAGGAFNTTITSGTIGQSTVYTIPDIGASTGDIVVSTAAVRMKSVAGAVSAGGAADQTFTDAFCTSGSNVIGNWNTQTNAASVLKIVPGNGSFVVTSSADAGAGTFNYIIMK